VYKARIWCQTRQLQKKSSISPSQRKSDNERSSFISTKVDECERDAYDAGGYGVAYRQAPFWFFRRVLSSRRLARQLNLSFVLQPLLLKHLPKRPTRRHNLVPLRRLILALRLGAYIYVHEGFMICVEVEMSFKIRVLPIIP